MHLKVILEIPNSKCDVKGYAEKKVGSLISL